MDAKKLQDAIEALQERSNELDLEKTDIDSLIKGLGRQLIVAGFQVTALSKGSTPNGSLSGINTQRLSKDKSFPKDRPIKEQIVYLFQNHLKQANRYPEIQEAYDKVSGLKRNLREDILALRREENPVLTALKFNSNTNSTYTGLTEWVIEGEIGPVFLPDFLELDPKRFPKGLNKSEWADKPAQIQEKQEGHTESVA